MSPPYRFLERNPGLVQRLEQFHHTYVCAEAYVVKPANVASRFCDFIEEHQSLIRSETNLRDVSPESILLLPQLFCIFVWQNRDELKYGLREANGIANVMESESVPPQTAEQDVEMLLDHAEQARNVGDKASSAVSGQEVDVLTVDCVPSNLKDEVSELSDTVVVDTENMIIDGGWTGMSVKQMVRDPCSGMCRKFCEDMAECAVLGRKRRGLRRRGRHSQFDYC